MQSQNNIYDTSFVQNLFDEMSGTYGIMNLISSFGFARRWRRQCVEQIDFHKSCAVVDLMSGMGELCPNISSRIDSDSHIIALDISPIMCKAARRYEKGKLRCPLRVIQANALCSNLAGDSCDVVVSAFGLKTFSDIQLKQLASEVLRILKPGGKFSFVEISVPQSPWLRAPFMFYLKTLIPLLGWLLKGNPDNYRLLGIYTEAFGNCKTALSRFQCAGLEAEIRSYFFGCATGLVGQKPDL